MNNKLLSTAIALSLVFAACASSSKQTATQQRVESQPVTTSPGSVREHIIEEIKADAALQADQKTQLLTLIDETAGKSRTIQLEINKTKSAMFDSLLMPNYKESEGKKLQKQVRRLMDDQLKVQLNAWTQAKKILGKDAPAETRARLSRVLGGHVDL